MCKRSIRFAGISRVFCLALVLAALTACGGGSDSGAPAEVIGQVTSASITSAKTGVIYSLQIYLPASYASGTTTYPVIYATDGDAAYPPNGRFQNFKEILQRRGTDAILVGIGGTSRRTTDFVLPGAIAYHDFITQELVPLIESRFRADPNRRVLSGLSLGGSFVVTALFLEAPTTVVFADYISAEGSVQQPSFLQLEQQFSDTIGTKPVPATLILARGTVSSDTNATAVDALYQRMVARNYAGLTLTETAFHAGHIATDNPSFEDAVIRLFE
jgi:predicted alpha/beta superfamily hydrolase